jgi:hypothetical protein
MTLNLAAPGGEVRVQVTRPDGRPIPGFRYADCAPVAGDALDAAVRWKGDLRTLEGEPVRLDFQLRRARLFGFSLH